MSFYVPRAASGAGAGGATAPPTMLNTTTATGANARRDSLRSFSSFKWNNSSTGSSVLTPASQNSAGSSGSWPMAAALNTIKGKAKAEDASGPSKTTVALAAATSAQQVASLSSGEDGDADSKQSWVADGTGCHGVTPFPSFIRSAGLNNFLFEACRGAPVHRWMAIVGAVWEVCQVFSFGVSASPALAWTTGGSETLSQLASAFQVIAFGYYIPASTNLVTAQFTIMFGLALLTLVLAAVLLIGSHPLLEDHRLEAKGAARVMRILLVGLSQWWYLPVVMQLMSTLRCSTATPFLKLSTCWTAGHAALATISAIMLPAVVALAAVAILTVHDHNMASTQPLARPHGRALLVVQVLKLIMAGLFAMDGVVSGWVLTIGIIVLQGLAAVVYVKYLPYFWQFLNRLFAGGYTAAVTASLLLVLGTARISSQTEALGWGLLFATPFAVLAGFTTAWLQWESGYQIGNASVGNVYQLELVVRRLLASSRGEDVLVQADVLMARGLQHFSTAGIVHMFVARYLADVRQNPHLERGHLQVLRHSGGPIDERFYAMRRTRELLDEAEAGDRTNVANRMRFDKLKDELRLKTVAARRLQVAFWSEAISSSPSLFRLLSLSTSIRRTLRQCDASFQKLLLLNPTSLTVTQLYAQFMREVANDAARAEELFESAAELEAANARTQVHEMDIIFMSMQPPVDANQDNVALVSISSLPSNLGAITDANSVFLQMTGYTRRELLGANVKMLIPEPIASMHQRYLEAYQATGRGVMLNATRTVFLLHKSGHLVPAVQTIRPYDNVINSVAIPIMTPDHFILVAMPSKKVTAMCQRSMATTQVTQAQLKDASLSISQLVQNFGAILEQHTAYVKQYEQTSLQALDGGQGAAAATKVPTDMVYDARVALSPGLSPRVATDTVAASMRLQLVKMTGASVILVKWKPTEAIERKVEPLQLPKPPSLASSGSFTGLSQNGSNGDESPTHGAVHSPIFAGALTVVGSPTVFASETKLAAAPAVRRPAQAKEPALKPYSGARSEGSSASAPSQAALRRGLKRVQGRTAPAVRLLRCNLILLMFTAMLILVTNCIVAVVLMNQTQAIRSDVMDVGHRLLAVQSATLRFQDLLLHSRGLAPLSSTAIQRRMTEINARLDLFDSLHHSLYKKSENDAAANAMYTTNNMAMYSKDAYGRVHMRMDNALNGGVSFVAEGRLALQESLAALNVNNTHLWFIDHNVDTLLDKLDDFLEYYMKAAVAALDATESVRTNVLFAVVVLFFILCFAVIVPSILRLHNVRKSLFHTMLEVPIPILRALRAQHEGWLEAALRVSEQAEDDEDLLDDGHEEASAALEAAINGSFRAAPAAAPKRPFKPQLLLFAGWVFVFMSGPLFAAGLFVALYYWGHIVAASASSFVVESYLVVQLSCDPQLMYYRARDAMATQDMSKSPALWSSWHATYDDLQADEQAVLYGATSGYPAPARSMLRLPDAHHLFNVDGCVDAATCPSFYYGLFKSGLEPATKQFLKLLSATTLQAESLLTDSRRWDHDAVKSLFATEWMRACDDMIHTHLVEAYAACDSILNAANAADSDGYISGLIAVTIICVVGMVFMYLIVYQPMLGAVNSQLHCGREMLLLLPDQVLRHVPAIRQIIKRVQEGDAFKLD